MQYATHGINWRRYRNLLWVNYDWYNDYIHIPAWVINFEVEMILKRYVISSAVDGSFKFEPRDLHYNDIQDIDNPAFPLHLSTFEFVVSCDGIHNDWGS